jgi:O-acetyl-ADP-ribose deacetylase (regulator of RNase III)
MAVPRAFGGAAAADLQEGQMQTAEQSDHALSVQQDSVETNSIEEPQDDAATKLLLHEEGDTPRELQQAEEDNTPRELLQAEEDNTPRELLLLPETATEDLQSQQQEATAAVDSEDAKDLLYNSAAPVAPGQREADSPWLEEACGTVVRTARPHSDEVGIDVPTPANQPPLNHPIHTDALGPEQPLATHALTATEGPAAASVRHHTPLEAATQGSSLSGPAAEASTSGLTATTHVLGSPALGQHLCRFPQQLEALATAIGASQSLRPDVDGNLRCAEPLPVAVLMAISRALFDTVVVPLVTVVNASVIASKLAGMALAAAGVTACIEGVAGALRVHLVWPRANTPADVVAPAGTSAATVEAARAVLEPHTRAEVCVPVDAQEVPFLRAALPWLQLVASTANPTGTLRVSSDQAALVVQGPALACQHAATRIAACSLTEPFEPHSLGILPAAHLAWLNVYGVALAGATATPGSGSSEMLTRSVAGILPPPVVIHVVADPASGEALVHARVLAEFASTEVAKHALVRLKALCGQLASEAASRTDGAAPTAAHLSLVHVGESVAGLLPHIDAFRAACDRRMRTQLVTADTAVGATALRAAPDALLGIAKALGATETRVCLPCYDSHLEEGKAVLVCLDMVPPQSTRNLDLAVSQLVRETAVWPVHARVSDVAQAVAAGHPSIAALYTDSCLLAVLEPTVAEPPAAAATIPPLTAARSDSVTGSSGGRRNGDGSPMGKMTAGGAHGSIGNIPSRTPAHHGQGANSLHALVCLREGALTISVRECDFTETGTVAVVNAANLRLEHGGGIARAIADAAGPDFIAESRDTVRKQGYVFEGTARATGAGHLVRSAGIHRIVHAVAPRCPSQAAAQQEHRSVLARSVFQAVQVADMEGLVSVAIPLIGSGIFGWDKDIAAEAIVEAVHVYDAYRVQHGMGGSLRSVVLFDRMPEKVTALARALQATALKTPGSATPPATPAEQQPVCWEWQGNDGLWTAYDDTVQHLLNTSSQNGLSQAHLSGSTASFTVDLQALKQTNIATGAWRAVRIQPRVAQPGQHPGARPKKVVVLGLSLAAPGHARAVRLSAAAGDVHASVEPAHPEPAAAPVGQTTSSLTFWAPGPLGESSVAGNSSPGQALLVSLQLPTPPPPLPLLLPAYELVDRMLGNSASPQAARAIRNLPLWQRFVEMHSRMEKPVVRAALAVLPAGEKALAWANAGPLAVDGPLGMACYFTESAALAALWPWQTLMAQPQADGGNAVVALLATTKLVDASSRPCTEPSFFYHGEAVCFALPCSHAAYTYPAVLLDMPAGLSDAVPSTMDPSGGAAKATEGSGVRVFLRGLPGKATVASVEMFLAGTPFIAVRMQRKHLMFGIGPLLICGSACLAARRAQWRCHASEVAAPSQQLTCRPHR